VTRDDALVLADRILALVNSKPQTPSREEIATLLEWAPECSDAQSISRDEIITEIQKRAVWTPELADWLKAGMPMTSFTFRIWPGETRTVRYQVDTEIKEVGCNCQPWAGQCTHCIAKDVLATPVDSVRPGMMLRHPNGMVRDVGDGADVAVAWKAWHDAWRKKL